MKQLPDNWLGAFMTPDEVAEWARISQSQLIREIVHGRLRIEQYGELTIVRQRHAMEWANANPAIQPRCHALRIYDEE